MQSMSSSSLQEELEALRRELQQTPILEEVETAAADAQNDNSSARAEIEKTLRDLQEKLAETADEAEDLIAAHPEYAEYRRRVPMLVPSLRLARVKASRTQGA